MLTLVKYKFRNFGRRGWSHEKSLIHVGGNLGSIKACANSNLRKMKANKCEFVFNSKTYVKWSYKDEWFTC